MAASRRDARTPIEARLAELITDLEAAPVRRGPGRPPVLPAALLWGGLLVTILSGAPSQRAVWRLIASRGLWQYPACPVSDEAVRLRLVTSQPTAMADLFAQATALLRERLPGDQHLAPQFPGGVFAMDSTTLDAVARPFQAGAPRPLAGRLHCLYDVRRQLFHHVLPTAQPRQNEQAAAPSLLATLPPGSLLLMDRGYTSYPRFDQLTASGQAFITRVRANASFVPRHTLTATGTVDDELVWLGAYKADRAAAMYRMVTIRHGAGDRRYLTNICDPARLPVAEIVRCYRRRWDIERAFKTIKRDLGLAWIWSNQRALIELQVWATLLIAQVASAVRQEVARRAAVPVEEVSLSLLLAMLPAMTAQVEGDVLEDLAARGAAFGLIRPVRRVAPALPRHLPITPAPTHLMGTRRPRYAGKV